MTERVRLRGARAAVAGAALLFALGAGAAGAHAPLDTVANFDLGRFLGRWFQIALIPNRFQEFCRGETTAEYALGTPGRIRVTNRCRDADGVLQSADGVARINRAYGDGARLEVRFAPAWLSWLSAVWGDYWVIEVDRDYRSMLVGSPDREFLWVLARQPALSAARYTALRERAAAAGFDVSRLETEPGIEIKP